MPDSSSFATPPFHHLLGTHPAWSGRSMPSFTDLHPSQSRAAHILTVSVVLKKHEENISLLGLPIIKSPVSSTTIFILYLSKILLQSAVSVSRFFQYQHCCLLLSGFYWPTVRYHDGEVTCHLYLACSSSTKRPEDEVETCGAGKTTWLSLSSSMSLAARWCPHSPCPGLALVKVDKFMVTWHWPQIFADLL
ncbi:hypothetical protein DPEC_G00108830 [Dallia pectoralis]|uniref:Uncharacterized protein n=1 Tax=Dallia pectoralis TaxID=75939 RepID=A0ACC2GSZ8_DALPE|nr:hypothetical protein DPEC_G00108830 [Dallia pectoralis]